MQDVQQSKSIGDVFASTTFALISNFSSWLNLNLKQTKHPSIEHEQVPHVFEWYCNLW